MKKMMLCLCAYLVVMAAVSPKSVSADETNIMNDEAKLERQISGIYQLINFSNSEPLPYEVFDKAYRGYVNLLDAGKLDATRQIITVCDLELPSTSNRMWIIDLAQKKVIFNTYVAHGQGSGEDGALSFSNRESTHKSSLGFYVTMDTYEGEHGTSLHLNGLDRGFNDAAYERSIVVHGADYVSDKFISSQERLGRSWGCPAVPSKLSLPIINTIKGGTCLFIYYPEQKYLNASCWLNHKITRLPDAGINQGQLCQDVPKPKVRLVQYETNGKIDSVKTISLPQ